MRNILSNIRIKCVQYLYNQKLVEKALIFFFFCYLYTIYDLLQFTVVSIFIISLTFTLKFEVKKLKQKGLIYYLPYRLQNLLTKSSVFDIFTFLWNPNFFLYLRTFYKPFFQNISPEEAIQNLDELPEQAKNVILTKGIVHSLPSFMQQLLLPLSLYQEIEQREEEEKREQQQKALLEQSKIENEEQGEGTNNNKDGVNSWGVVQHSNNNNKKSSYNNNGIYKSVIEEEDLCHLADEKQSQLYKISQKSSAFSFRQGIQDDYSNSYQNEYLNKYKFEDRKINNRVDSLRKLMLTEQPLDIKTKVIASSQDTNKPQKIDGENKKEISFEDNINQIFESIKTKFQNSNGDTALGQIKNAVNLLMGVAEIKKNTTMLHKIENTKIYKLFVISAIFLLSQYFISKKTRKWLISSTMFAAYILSFFLTFGTLGIFIYKNANSQNKESHPRQLSIKDQKNSHSHQYKYNNSHSSDIRNHNNTYQQNSTENDKVGIIKRKSKKKLQKSDDNKYLVDDQQI